MQPRPTLGLAAPTSHRLLGATLLAAMLAVPHSAAAWNGSPTPLDDHHLALVRPGDFRSLAGGPADIVPCPQAIFGGTALAVGDGGAVAAVRTPAAEEYDVWIRVGQQKGPPIAIEAVLGPEKSPLLAARFNDGLGDADRGGPNGLTAYAARARGRSPDGRATGAEGGKLGEAADELLVELGGEAAAAERFDHAGRIDEVDPKLPLHWWRLGRVKLAAGVHRLSLRPAAAGSKGSVPLVDAVMLTSSPHVRYPFRGDIDARRECYVRFRLDGPFAEGQHLSITAPSVLHHRHPGYWTRGVFAADGVRSRSAEPARHRAAGFTRWYSLQDFEDVPGVGGYPLSLWLSLEGTAGRGGATQFAMFPHADFVLREIPWDEPDGLRISMVLDFERYLDRLRTFRDHARDTYQMAAASTGGRLFPLSRGGLLFGSNAAQGEASRDYELKTLRLLGLNLVSAADPAANCRRYGFRSPIGHHAPQWPPFDPDATAARYDAHYRTELKEPRYAEPMPTAAVMQIADEPREAARSTISAPLWRYREPAPKQGAWMDLAGSGEMRTRRVDYADRVLEGRISQQGSWVGFRAAVADSDTLARQAFWRVGRVKPPQEVNLEAGRDREPSAFLLRPTAVIGGKPTPFKIVHHGDRAALFLNGKMVLQHDGVAPAGGFAIYGDTKTVHELRIRPLARDESLQPPGGRGLGETQDEELDAELEDAFGHGEGEDDPAKRLGLRAWVKRDWSFTGGIPEAHVGFRRWLESQGVEPALFDCRSWNDVMPLSIESAIETPADRRRYYWTRRYTGMLTPLMFRQTAEAIHRNANNPGLRCFVGLSGHSLYFPSEMPLDMFALGAAGPHLIPGISDWMSYGKTRWDSHQAVAYSVAPFHSGGRDTGANRAFPMMHCVHPSAFRAYTMLANDVKYVSFYDFGPKYSMTVGYWSDDRPAHDAVHAAANRAAQVDDILAAGSVRRSRVGMLYARSSEYWDGPQSFADKRAAFLVLSQEGYQPELVTEEQVLSGRLADYDALVVLEPWVRTDAAATITAWVDAGGLLMAAADAMMKSEFDEPADVLATACGLRREFRAGSVEGPARRFAPVAGVPAFRPHDIAASRVAKVSWPGSRELGRYGDGVAGWLDRPQGKGRVVYFGHRPGLTATAQAVRVGGHEAIWADAGRDVLVRPLLEAGVERELIVSEPVVMAQPISTDAGTVIVMHNMRPASFDAVEVSLREPAAPHSVQRFSGHDLVEQPWEYRDGRVRMSLPLAEDEPQMIVVRRRPPPPDERERELRSRCDTMLASTDSADRSAAVYFMGFHPEWKSAARLRPLLADARWEVRRAAVEAMGRLGDAESAATIRTGLTRETDTHVRVEMLTALSMLGDPQIVSLGLAHAEDRHPLVRQAGLAAIAAGLRQSKGSVPADVLPKIIDLAAAAIGDRNVRIRTAGLDLLGLLAPADMEKVLTKTGEDAGAVARAAIVAETPGPLVARLLEQYRREPAAVESPLADAVAGSAKVRAAFPGWPDAVPLPLLLAVGERWADADTAGAIAKRLDEVKDPGRLRAIALVQRDPVLSLALLKRAGAGDNPLGGLLPLVLEKTFDARLGPHSLAAWEQWAQANASTITKRKTRGGAATVTADDENAGTAPELDADTTGQP